MSDMDELEIKIDEDGNVSIKVLNGKGEKCVELTRELEEALGLVDKRALTDDYYQEEEVEIEDQIEGHGG